MAEKELIFGIPFVPKALWIAFGKTINLVFIIIKEFGQICQVLTAVFSYRAELP